MPVLPSLPPAPLIESIRQLTGLKLCVKVFHSPLPHGTQVEVLADTCFIHDSSFCMSVKKARSQACIQCDLRDVPALCERKKTIFTNVCHAGAEEIIIPVFFEGTLSVIGFLGQYRRTRKGNPLLPRLSPDDIKRSLDAARLIAAYLEQQLRAPRFASHTARGYREEMIRRFLGDRLRKNPRLPDLAKHLGLSLSRTSHLTEEITGHSFTRLRDALRLERAKSLLSNTRYKISHIATECGVPDAGYFHRFFRRQTGMTPLAFRRSHPLPA